MSELVFIEHEGQVYRGISRAWPTEIWSEREGRFVQYFGRIPKPIEWGNEISEAEARRLLGDEPAEVPDAPIESGDDEPSFWTVAAKHPFVMRLTPPDGVEFFNRKTLAWAKWPGEMPPCARLITKAAAWTAIYHETRRLDFGTLDREHRDWPEPASG